ncbi:MAG: hypothetical protein AAF291_00710 [Pseudomonadota bacterium]
MALDHIVYKSPQRSRLIGRLNDGHGFKVLPGFKWNDQLLSEGVRFSNGPFIDVFDWPPAKAPFKPLLAIEADLADAEGAAQKQGWSFRVFRHRDVPVDERPPWSILSFTRGQGLVSSLFLIEYEDDPEAWRNKQFSGLLYERSDRHRSSVELTSVEILSADVSESMSQLDKLAAAPMHLLKFKPATDARDDVGSIHFQAVGGEAMSLSLSNYDRFRGD